MTPEHLPEATGSRPAWISWTLALGLALIAGVASGLIGEATFEWFKPDPKLVNAQDLASFDTNRMNAEYVKVNGRNGAILYGTLGGLIGLALGVAGGLSRPKTGSIAFGAAAGLALGAVAGALPAFPAMAWIWGHRSEGEGSPIQPLLFHTSLWAALGAAAGLAFALGRTPRDRARWAEGAVGGLVGAGLGAFLYEISGAVLLSSDARTHESFAHTSSGRLLAHLCVAIGVAIGVLIAAHPRGKKDVPPRPAPTVEPGTEGV